MTIRILLRSTALAAAGLLLAWATIAAEYQLLPDSAKTPGAVATTDKAVICGRMHGLTYTRRHRVWDHQAQTFAKYGVTRHKPHEWEDDDRVPVCAGGDNSDPRNHWPQPSDKLVGKGNGYESKDVMDAGACRLLCKPGSTLTTQTVQSWFLLPDWRAGLQEYMRAAGK